MKLATCNLSPERADLLRDEIEITRTATTGQGLSMPDWTVHVVALSRRNPSLPPAIQTRCQLEPVDETATPTTMPARVAWEEKLQTYQVITLEKTAWIIGGGEMGAVYGFYAFLKRATGIRWYGLTDGDICFAEPADRIDIQRSPRLVLRGFEEYLGHDNPATYFRRYMRWMVRQGWNLMLLNAAKWAAYPHRQAFIEQARCYGIRLAVGAHAPELFLPEATFETHPEWFSYRDGQRRLRGPIEIPELPGLDLESAYQPCYTNPEARAFIADNIAAYVSRFPEADIFSLWPHDGINNWCQCDTCLQTTPYAAMHALALDLQERLPPTMPIEVLCYSNMMNVPSAPLPQTDRTYTLFCPYLRHYRHRFFAPGFPSDKLVTGTRYPQPDRINPVDDREYGLLLERWLPVLAQCGSVLGIFAYYQSAFHDETRRSDAPRYICRPDPLLVEDEIDRFAESGAKVFYDCSHPSPGFWPDGRLYAYLPDLLWTDSEGAEALVETFYTATLGEQLGSRMQACMKELGDSLSDRSQPLPPELLERLEALIHEIPGARGRRYSLWLAYLRLGLTSWQAAQEDRLEDVVALEEQIIAFLQSHETKLAWHLEAGRLTKYARAVIAYFASGQGSGALPD